MEAENSDKYKALLSEIIAKQSVILGPEISVLKARNVPGITISDNGVVTEISGDYRQILEKLVDEYVALSGMIVKNALSSIFAKYPELEKK
ncbi:MAG: hypothetical protein US18_C0009G0004 [Parcubacteria group bacterium GW2011_GWB1_36_5]|nr:MAG: hypothetical protein US12_C0009G0005 [Parcubacteria group bacterium GW2011_GWA2_36_24]KKQ07725.1 MAG: hypothetical protein US18_C0009G0004 [Parcubacteria group bacterium GW2011_GWB1_36_5]